MNKATVEVRRLMPKPHVSATTSPRTLGELYSGAMAYRGNPGSIRSLYPWADRFVCGLPLAPWQRPVVWDTKMQSRFIDAMWAGVDTGSYMVNAWIEFTSNSGEEARYLSDVVIDGQQRLTSLERYFNDEIPATAADGKLLLFSEITKADRRFFQNCIFPRSIINTDDEQLLREAYDMRAFGGMRHTEDQRALPMSEP